jgi:hypothetical protein
VLTRNDISRLSDADVYDTACDMIGSVGQVYLDAQSGDPEWVTVKTGLFGTTTARSTMSRKTSSTPTTACIRRGRTTGSSGYELGNVERRGGSARDRDTTGRHASDAEDQIMTRSEERLTVDTQREQVGKARLGKYAVTEQ